MHGKKLFLGLENVRGFFFKDIAPVHEIEHPYRSCNHALFLHVWPGKALVIGWWKKRHDMDTNVMKALGGRIVQENEITGQGLVCSALREDKAETETDEFS